MSDNTKLKLWCYLLATLLCYFATEAKSKTYEISPCVYFYGEKNPISECTDGILCFTYGETNTEQRSSHFPIYGIKQRTFNKILAISGHFSKVSKHDESFTVTASNITILNKEDLKFWYKFYEGFAFWNGKLHIKDMRKNRALNEHIDFDKLELTWCKKSWQGDLNLDIKFHSVDCKVSLENYPRISDFSLHLSNGIDLIAAEKFSGYNRFTIPVYEAYLIRVYEIREKSLDVNVPIQKELIYPNGDTFEGEIVFPKLDYSFPVGLVQANNLCTENPTPYTGKMTYKSGATETFVKTEPAARVTEASRKKAEDKVIAGNIKLKREREAEAKIEAERKAAKAAAKAKEERAEHDRLVNKYGARVAKEIEYGELRVGISEACLQEWWSWSLISETKNTRIYAKYGRIVGMDYYPNLISERVICKNGKVVEINKY